jgi:hypothetical protein
MRKKRRRSIRRKEIKRKKKEMPVFSPPKPIRK